MNLLFRIFDAIFLIDERLEQRRAERQRKIQDSERTLRQELEAAERKRGGS